jgi:tetratricopeptide (TPR) repeat protein
MTRRNDSSDKPAPFALPELLAEYLRRQASAHAAGLALTGAAGEVEPYDAGPAQPVEPRLAWDEAVAAVRSFEAPAAARKWKAPPEWPALVASQEPVAALAFCAGNFPQLVRNLQPLLQAKDLTALRGNPGRPAEAPGLVEWAEAAARKGEPADALLAAGALRLARQFDRAAEVLRRRPAGDGWRAAWANEEAALAWHRGRADEAAASWRGQPDSAPVLFNRGMAALFLGRPDEARAALRGAAALLPEAGAWHHLAQLYLALAEIGA